MCRWLAALTVLIAALAPVAARGDAADFSAFAGPWEHHGSVMTVDATGLMMTVGTPGTPWATVPTGTAHLSAVTGDTAYGTDDQSGDPVWLVLLPNDMLLISDTVAQTATVFCGPNTWFDDSQPGMNPWPCGL